MRKVLGQDTQGEVHASFAAHRIARSLAVLKKDTKIRSSM